MLRAGGVRIQLERRIQLESLVQVGVLRFSLSERKNMFLGYAATPCKINAMALGGSNPHGFLSLGRQGYESIEISTVGVVTPGPPGVLPLRTGYSRGKSVRH